MNIFLSVLLSFIPIAAGSSIYSIPTGIGKLQVRAVQPRSSSVHLTKPHYSAPAVLYQSAPAVAAYAPVAAARPVPYATSYQPVQTYVPNYQPVKAYQPAQHVQPVQSYAPSSYSHAYPSALPTNVGGKKSANAYKRAYNRGHDTLTKATGDLDTQGQRLEYGYAELEGYGLKDYSQKKSHRVREIDVAPDYEDDVDVLYDNDEYAYEYV